MRISLNWRDRTLIGVGYAELHHESAIAVLVRVAHTGLRVQRAWGGLGRRNRQPGISVVQPAGYVASGVVMANESAEMKQSLNRPVEILRRAMIICLLGTVLAVARVSSAQQIDGILQALRQESTPDTVEERQEAVLRISRSESIRQNEAVQVPLIEAVDRANAEYLARIRNRDPTYSEGQGELFLALIRTVVQTG